MRRFILITGICLAVGGTATAFAQGNPAIGARLAADAAQADDRAGVKAARSAQWIKGGRIAADGEKLMRRSERRLLSLSRDAQRYEDRNSKLSAAQRREEAFLAEGQRLVDQGHSLQVEAEAAFQAGSSG